MLPYDDEATPLRLTGTKMLPIMEIDGKAHNESLDIMTLLDVNNKLDIQSKINDPEFAPLNEILSRMGSLVHSLAMPYWIWTPEFNDSSRAYFQKKKEVKRGPFKELVRNQRQFVDAINTDFSILTKNFLPFYKSSTFGVYDILIAAHLWGLYVVPEFRFPEELHGYLQRVKAECGFNYHEDFWR